MNVLKTIFSSLLLLMVACQFSTAEAATNENQLPVYQNIITDISLEYEGALLGGTIKINDSQILRIKDYKNRDDNVMKNWLPGNLVAIEAHKIDNVLVLSLNRIGAAKDENVEPYVIFDVLDSEYNALTIVEIQNNGGFVRLNNDSVWEFGFVNHFSTKHWSVGERVIVQGPGKCNSYEFINLDVPVAKNCTNANGSFVIN